MTEEVLAFSNATQAGCSTREPREASSNKNQIQYVCGPTLHSCIVVHVIESLVNVHHDDLWFHLKVSICLGNQESLARQVPVCSAGLPTSMSHWE